jgi:hypothetical protein
MTATPGDALVGYRRFGGRPPRDDEAFDLAEDGSFTGRRTVAGAKVGTFRGRLAPERLAAIRGAVDGVRGSGDVDIGTPLDGATETLEAAGQTARMGSNERPTGPWKPVIELVREILDADLVAAPRAALELEATSRTASIAQAGSEAVEIDLASVVLRVVRIDAGGLVLGRWQERLGPAVDEDSAVPVPSWTTAGPGWRLPLPFGHGLELAQGDWLQVWAFATFLDVAGDGVARDARLFVAVPG